MTAAARDEAWMREALALARRGEGRTRPNPPVGAIVVRRGVCVGRGWHRKAGGPHAEVWALRAAGSRARGATLYVTLEPCCTQGRTPPCTDLILRMGVARVVVAVRDPNPRHRGRGAALLRRAGVAVEEGVCAEEGAALLAPFAKWIAAGTPYVTLKMGMSMDGKIADAAGRSRWITSAQSRRAVQGLRRRADAIMVGRGTAAADDPSLLCKDRARGHPYRVIVDSSGALPVEARVLNDEHRGMTLVATTRRCSARQREAYRAKGAQVWELPLRSGRVSLRCLLTRLGRLGVLHAVCEGGGTLAAALIREGLVDEYLFFVAPRVIGGTKAPVVGGEGWSLRATPRVRFVECRRVGQDVLLRAVPAPGG